MKYSWYLWEIFRKYLQIFANICEYVSGNTWVYLKICENPGASSISTTWARLFIFSRSRLCFSSTIFYRENFELLLHRLGVASAHKWKTRLIWRTVYSVEPICFYDYAWWMYRYQFNTNNLAVEDIITWVF